MLADAGVELGVNYPLPVISIEESEEALAQAMATIQESLVEVNDKANSVAECVNACRINCMCCVDSS